MDSKKLAQLCRDFAENRKAENVVILNVSEVSSITDYFVIASGTSAPHLRAIVSEIEDKLRDEHHLRPHASQGDAASSSWIVLDFFDVIVHIMRPEVRAQYDLESLWKDAPLVKPAKAKVARKPKVKAA